MSNSLIFNAPINSVSFGQVSYNIARELYKRKIDTYFLPFQFDLTAYNPDDDFRAWLNAAHKRGLKKYTRSMPTLRIWHINQSEQRPSNRQVLLTFHETDEPTEEEINIVNQQDFTFFSSTYSKENFELAGAQNIDNVNLGFDPDIIANISKPKSKFITHWILVGKWEMRKNTAMIIKTWLKKYAKNPAHSLTLVVFNPFLHRKDPHAHEKYFAQLFEGKPKPFNVQIFNPLRTNAEINQLYNDADIDLSGLSNSEGWGLPAFNASALGKWSIVTNCTAHKDWATKDNCVLVEPIGKQPSYDDVHFFRGQPFNQGNFYLITEQQIALGMDEALKRVKQPNTEGLKLQETHTYSKTVDKLLSKLF